MSLSVHRNMFCHIALLSSLWYDEEKILFSERWRAFPPMIMTISSSSSTIDHHHHHLTNAVSSSNSSQGVTATYCSIDGPGPPLNCCLGSTDANLTRCYTPQHTCEIPNGRISAVYAQQHQQPPLKQFVVTDNNIQYYPDNYASLPQCFTNANYAAAVNVYNNEYHREDATTVPFIGENALTVIESSNRSSDRPASPVSISTTDGVVAPCGGHCRTFEKFCHYFLLVSFLVLEINSPLILYSTITTLGMHFACMFFGSWNIQMRAKLIKWWSLPWKHARQNLHILHHIKIRT